MELPLLATSLVRLLLTMPKFAYFIGRCGIGGGTARLGTIFGFTGLVGLGGWAPVSCGGFQLESAGSNTSGMGGLKTGFTGFATIAGED